MSFKPNLSDPERILYAALAPCPQTFSVLKSACRTWEDHLWAQISILCEEKQTADMIKLGGGFWDGGLAVLENMPSPPSQEEDAAEEEEWEREATSTLETLGSVHVEEGYGLHTCVYFPCADCQSVPSQTTHFTSLSWRSSSIGQIHC
jgi:nuclear pore complex protein Nup107